LRRRLFWKIGLTYLSLLFFSVGAVYLYTGRVVERNTIDASLARLDALHRLAELRPPDLTDTESLRAWTDWLSESGVRVTVIATDGKVLADSDEDPVRMDNHATRPEVLEAMAEGRGSAVRFSNTVHRDLVYVARKRDWGPSPPSIVRLAEPLVRIEDAVSEVRRPVGLALMVLLIVGGAGSFLLSRRLSERVASLRALSQRLAEGDFTHVPIPDRAPEDLDELDELAAALNETASRLEESIRSLREERNQSSAILRSMSEGVAVVGSDARILYLNRAFRDTLGIQGESWTEFRGRPLSEIVEEPRLVELTLEALEHERRAESAISLDTWPPRQLLIRTAPVSGVSEGGAVVVLLDVTELHRLERVRRDFVANVSHELKTPLTAIQGFAETLLDGAVDNPEHSRRFLEIIRQHAVRLGRLTNDLLKLSSIESGRQEPRIETLELDEIIAPLVETTRMKAEAKNIRVEVEIAGELPPVESDGHWLSEVLQNLLDNAVQYTPEGGHIRVRGAASPAEVRIDISDDGIGIAADKQSRIFERFYRVDEARSRAVGGTGLGLAIARHLVDSLGGRLEVESELGKGSTFTVVLPR
jgi:two-component system phosphate regulon sensor histidine kinase PhoR